MKKEPHHFSNVDFGNALLGSFVVTLTFIFKGSMVNFAKQMQTQHVVAVILATFIFLTLEIYLLSYRYVQDRMHRPFSEFWAKRFFAITISSCVMILLVIYLYGINIGLTSAELVKVTAAIFMPAVIVGAAVEILKKK